MKQLSPSRILSPLYSESNPTEKMMKLSLKATFLFLLSFSFLNFLGFGFEESVLAFPEVPEPVQSEHTIHYPGVTYHISNRTNKIVKIDWFYQYTDRPDWAVFPYNQTYFNEDSGNVIADYFFNTDKKIYRVDSYYPNQTYSGHREYVRYYDPVTGIMTYEEKLNQTGYLTNYTHGFDLQGRAVRFIEFYQDLFAVKSSETEFSYQGDSQQAKLTTVTHFDRQGRIESIEYFDGSNTTPSKTEKYYYDSNVTPTKSTQIVGFNGQGSNWRPSDGAFPANLKSITQLSYNGVYGQDDNTLVDSVTTNTYDGLPSFTSPTAITGVFYYAGTTQKYKEYTWNYSAAGATYHSETSYAYNVAHADGLQVDWVSVSTYDAAQHPIDPTSTKITFYRAGTQTKYREDFSQYSAVGNGLWRATYYYSKKWDINGNQTSFVEVRHYYDAQGRTDHMEYFDDGAVTPTHTQVYGYLDAIATQPSEIVDYQGGKPELANRPLYALGTWMPLDPSYAADLRGYFLRAYLLYQLSQFPPPAEPVSLAHVNSLSLFSYDLQTIYGNEGLDVLTFADSRISPDGYNLAITSKTYFYYNTRSKRAEEKYTYEMVSNNFTGTYSVQINEWNRSGLQTRDTQIKFIEKSDGSSLDRIETYENGKIDNIRYYTGTPFEYGARVVHYDTLGRTDYVEYFSGNSDKPVKTQDYYYYGEQGETVNGPLAGQPKWIFTYSGAKGTPDIRQGDLWGVNNGRIVSVESYGYQWSGNPETINFQFIQSKSVYYPGNYDRLMDFRLYQAFEATHHVVEKRHETWTPGGNYSRVENTYDQNTEKLLSTQEDNYQLRGARAWENYSKISSKTTSYDSEGRVSNVDMSVYSSIGLKTRETETGYGYFSGEQYVLSTRKTEYYGSTPASVGALKSQVSAEYELDPSSLDQPKTRVTHSLEVRRDERGQLTYFLEKIWTYQINGWIIDTVTVKTKGGSMSTVLLRTYYDAQGNLIRVENGNTPARQAVANAGVLNQLEEKQAALSQIKQILPEGVSSSSTLATTVNPSSLVGAQNS